MCVVSLKNSERAFSNLHDITTGELQEWYILAIHSRSNGFLVPNKNYKIVSIGEDFFSRCKPGFFWM